MNIYALSINRQSNGSMATRLIQMGISLKLNAGIHPMHAYGCINIRRIHDSISMLSFHL